MRFFKWMFSSTALLAAFSPSSPFFAAFFSAFFSVFDGSLLSSPFSSFFACVSLYFNSGLCSLFQFTHLSCSCLAHTGITHHARFSLVFESHEPTLLFSVLVARPELVACNLVVHVSPVVFQLSCEGEFKVLQHF